MCYDISFTTSVELITDYIPDLVVDPQLAISYEPIVHVVAQSYIHRPVVIKENGKRHLKEFEWGVIADYMNTAELIKKNRQWMCNAQSEKILDKKSYWYRIRKKRCIIPARAFFEHREIKGWKTKVPYMIKPRGRDMFCFLGLYNYSPIPNVETGEVRGTFTIITRAANSIMKQIHNGGPNAGRMPLIVPKELELRWIDEELTDEEIGSILNYEWPAEELEYHTVHTIRTTKERPDGKGKLEPFEWANLPPLGVDAEQTLF
jgi:putative SOS response-associated peptidase YedK